MTKLGWKLAVDAQLNLSATQHRVELDPYSRYGHMRMYNRTSKKFQASMNLIKYIYAIYMHCIIQFLPELNDLCQYQHKFINLAHLNGLIWFRL